MLLCDFMGCDGLQGHHAYDVLVLCDDRDSHHRLKLFLFQLREVTEAGVSHGCFSEVDRSAVQCDPTDNTFP